MFKRLGLALLGTVLLTGPLLAQNNTTRFFFAYASETSPITIDNTVGGKGFTTAKINPSTGQAQAAQFRVSCASSSPCDINFTIDGSTVTAAHGMLLHEGDIVTLYSYQTIAAFRAIRIGSNSATIDPIYSR